MIRSITKSKKSEEKAMLLIILGCLTALRKGIITCDESQGVLFSPGRIKNMKIAKYDKRIIRLVGKCLELEDVLSLLPQKYMDTLDELIEETVHIVSTYECFDEESWLDVRKEY